jgi:hypothetical protein
MLHTFGTSVLHFQVLNRHVAGGSNDQDYAVGNGKCCGNDASVGVIGSDSNAIRLTGSSISRGHHGVTSPHSLTGCIPGDWSCQCPYE